LRVEIAHGGDNPSDSGGMYSLDARPGAARVAARFERAVQRTALGTLAGSIERDDLGVRPAGAEMCPLAGDESVGVDHDGANNRIRRRAASATLGVKERALHPHRIVRISYHFSVNSAST
jgi:hypothetical protein